MRLSLRTWRLAGLVALGVGVTFTYACSDKPVPTDPTGVAPQFSTGDGVGWDLNAPSPGTLTINGGVWTWPVPYKVGTGLINPFLSFQSSPTEHGFNSDINVSGNGPYDSKQANTESLPLNVVPIIKYNGAYYREIILDVNESNSVPDAQFSFDFFDLWLCNDPAAPTWSTSDQFENNIANCVQIYDIDPHIGFGTDAASQGSGNALDYQILIPDAAFSDLSVGGISASDYCPYNPLATSCGVYVILHVNMGAFGGDWITNGGFEEYSTVKQPFVQIAKTAVPAFTRTYDWTIDKSVDPTDIYLFDGQSQDAGYTVTVSQTGYTDSGWSVSGSITIHNPSGSDATISSITDLLQPGGLPVTLGAPCAPGNMPVLLVAGGDLVCPYTYTFGDDPGGTVYTNTVEVELQGLAVTVGESESFAFTTPTTTVNETVDVQDYFDDTDVTTVLDAAIAAGDTYTYSHTYTCNDDAGSHHNTASVIGDGDVVLDSDDATVNVNCLDVEVTKDAATALERTYKWTIDKSVTPDSWALFDGDDGTSDYTVAVTPDGFDDADWKVTGNIHVHNPNAVSVYLTNVADAISGGVAATVDCGGISYPYELAAGATLDCTYEASLADGTDRTNTATATAKPTSDGETKDFTGTADVSFAGVTLTEVNKIIHVTDTYAGGLGTADWAAGTTNFTYPRTFTCGGDEGDHGNTATITETGQSDDASVAVSCYDLAVTKTATTTFKRTYNWKIVKSVDPDAITLFDGQDQSVAYKVEVLPDGYTDSDWHVSGTITVENHHPTMAATLLQVRDAIASVGSVSVSCPATTVPAGGSLECTYETDLPSANPGTNSATARQQNYSYDSDGTRSLSGYTEYSGSADFDFSHAPDVEVNKTVNVTDNVEGVLGSVNWDTGHTFEYSHTYACNEDEGQHDNIATITETGQSDDASVTVNCLDVEVTKDATTSLERTYKWTIDKSVTPDSWALFDGDDGTSDYTVAVTPDGYDDTQWMVDGNISVHNPNAVPVYIIGVVDELVPGPVAGAVDCGVSYPFELAAGATLNCTYEAALGDGSDLTNHATVTAKPTSDGAAKDFAGTAAVSFAGATLTEVNKTIHVTDTYPSDPTSLGTADWDAGTTNFTYSRTFACGGDEGEHGNTATITETGQSDGASVTVSCYDLAVTKDAATTWSRTWSWTIDKQIDPSCFLDGTYDAGTNTATIQQNEILTVCYSATVAGTYTDGDYVVTQGASGIVVHNNHPSMAATLNSVSDVVSPAIAATVDCGVTFPYDLAAGGDLTCSYSADLSDVSDRTNTATATQQNHSYASDGSASDAGTTDYSGSASVAFSSTPTVETDECVDVDDALQNAGADVGSKTFGTFCATPGNQSATYDYSYIFGPDDIPVECGPNTFDNTATFVTNDTGATDFSGVVLNIFVQCEEGCTLTLGYWKTHNESFGGGASKKADPTWYLLDGGLAENTTFFLSGQTWYEVFWTNPQGNVYYNLAWQYMAAVLNGLAGASTTDVDAALAQAKALFEAYTPAQIGALRGRPTDQALRQQFINLAKTLDDYNQGLTGPGHCTENAPS